MEESVLNENNENNADEPLKQSDLTPKEEARGIEYARQLKKVGWVGMIIGDVVCFLLLEFFLICVGWSFRMYPVADLVVSLLSVFLFVHFSNQAQVLIPNQYVRWALMVVCLFLPIAFFALVGYLDIIPEWKVNEEIRNLF